MEISSLEDVERHLRQQLGDKYDLAMKNCYSILQIHCGMSEEVPPNTFICKYTGGAYRLTKNGFVSMYRVEADKIYSPIKKKRNKWFKW